MRKLLSIIIPTYNAEKFLDKGLPSLILSDETKRSQMEVLIVNDGTKDNSVAVAQKYVDQYPDLFHIINKENGGHGSAINVGVDHATGIYFKCMDADDWYTTETLEHLVEALAEMQETCHHDRNNVANSAQKAANLDKDTTDTQTSQENFDDIAAVDAMLISYRTYDLQWEAEGKNPYTSKDIVVDAISKEAKEFSEGKYHLPIVNLRQIMNHWDDMYWGVTFHGMLYATDFYKGLNHKLLEGFFYEDQEFATVPFSHAKRIALFPEELYEYRIGDVNQSISISSSLKRLDHYEAVIMRLLEAEAQAKTLPAGGKDYWATKTSKFIDDYLQLCLVKNPDKKMLRKRMADFMEKIKKTSPYMYDMVKKNYAVFYGLNRVHMSEETFQNKFMPLLHKLRGSKLQ